MKKPANLELKKWLCDNHITGIKVFYVMTGVDTAETEWEIYSDRKKKRLRASIIEPMLVLKPDFSTLARVQPAIRDEVNSWTQFAKKEAKDLAEYERLKAKFGD